MLSFIFMCKFFIISRAFCSKTGSLLAIPFGSIIIVVSGRAALIIMALEITQILETTPTRVISS